MGIIKRLKNRAVDKVNAKLDETETSADSIRAMHREAQGDLRKMRGSYVDVLTERRVIERRIVDTMAEQERLVELAQGFLEAGRAADAEAAHRAYENNERRLTAMAEQHQNLVETEAVLASEGEAAAVRADMIGSHGEALVVQDSANRVIIEARERQLGVTAGGDERAAQAARVQAAIERRQARADVLRQIAAGSMPGADPPTLRALEARAARPDTASWLERVRAESRLGIAAPASNLPAITAGEQQPAQAEPAQAEAAQAQAAAAPAAPQAPAAPPAPQAKSAPDAGRGVE